MRLIRVFSVSVVLSCAFLATDASFANFKGLLGGLALPGSPAETNSPPSRRRGSDGNRNACVSAESLVCNFQGSVSGVATYSPKWESGNCYVEFKTDLSGLEKGESHKIHIHKFGDVSSDDGKSTGGHYYGPNASDDMSDEEKLRWFSRGLLEGGSNGKVKTSTVDKYITLDGIVGRGMVIHGGADPSMRVGYCVIGYANPDY